MVADKENRHAFVLSDKLRRGFGGFGGMGAGKRPAVYEIVKYVNYYNGTVLHTANIRKNQEAAYN